MLGTTASQSRHPRATASLLSLDVRALARFEGCTATRAVDASRRRYAAPQHDGDRLLVTIYCARRCSAISVPLMVAISVSTPSCTA